jgi:hypothetical protein
LLVLGEGRSSYVREVVAGLGLYPLAIAKNPRPCPVHLVVVVIVEQPVVLVPAHTALVPKILTFPCRDDVLKSHASEEQIVDVLFVVENNGRLQDPEPTLKLK